MSSTKLKDYGSVPIIDATTAIDPNVSWVEAHVINKEGENDKEGMMLMGIETVSATHSSQFTSYRDLPFAVAFVAHLVAMGIVGLISGSYNGLFNIPSTHDAVNGDSSIHTELCVEILTMRLSCTTTTFNPSDADAFFTTSAGYLPVILVASISGVASILIPSIVTSGFIPRYPRATVSASLLLSTICNISLAILLVIYFPKWYTAVISLLWIGVSIWFYRRIQRFIPYAAAVMKIASDGISRHWGIYIVSFASSILSFLWLGYWVYVANGLELWADLGASNTSTTSTTGAYYYDYASGASGGGSMQGKLAAKVFFLLLSLYWTSTVLMNITQTTVAGVIATYCFENPSIVSNPSSTSPHKTVSQSLSRALTTSLGSICFGSLLNALVTTLRVMADYAREQARRNNEAGMAMLFCVLQCILSIIEDIIEYFNQWAYTFVGIYGTSYLESGKMVLELFRARGCEAILTNGLNMYVLNAIVGITGLVCGLMGGFVATVSSYAAGGLNGWLGFGMGFMIGVIFSSIMASTLQGAVKGVLICYIDHPGKMHEMHSEDTKVLGNAISLVFPDIKEFRFTDANVTVV